MANTTVLNFNGADTSTTITDVVGVVTWTAVADAQLDTAQKKYGSASLLVDGTGDYVSSTDIGALPASGGWTIQFWVRFSVVPNWPPQTPFKYIKAASGFGVKLEAFDQFAVGNSKLWLSLSSNGTSADICSQDGPGTVICNTADTWYHIAIVRDSSAGAYYLYVDGVLYFTKVSASLISNTLDRCDVGTAINGWFDDVVVSNACLYPGGTTFTPPTSEAGPTLLNFSMTGSGGGSSTGTATRTNTKVITGSGGGSSSGASSSAAIHFASAYISYPVATPSVDFQAEFGSSTSTSFDIVPDELVITGGTDVNVYDQAVLAAIDVSGPVDLIVRVTGVVTRLYWDNSFRWHPRSKFKLKNQSTIVGHGGNGGIGGSASTGWNGGNGTDGGTGIELNGYTISIDNSLGKIYGGGGGAGGGAGADVLGLFVSTGFSDVWTDIWFGHFGWVSTAHRDELPCSFRIAGGGGGGGYNGGTAGLAGTGFAVDTNLTSVGYSRLFSASDGDAGTLAPTEDSGRGDIYGQGTLNTSFSGGTGGKNFFPGEKGANGKRAVSVYGVYPINTDEELSQFGTPGVGGLPGKAINLSGGTINWISGRGFPNVIGEVS